MTGLNATAAGAPVGSVQQKISAGTFHFVIRPIGGAPKQSEGSALRLVRLGELQRVQIAAHQPLDPRSDNVIPLGLARELSDLSVAKVAQARKLNGAPALPRPAPCSSWDPVTPMLLTELPDDLLGLILASRTEKLVWSTARELRVREGYLRTSGYYMNAGLQITEGHALAEAGACCQTFATCARAAAKIVADRHGWRLLPVAGSTPMQHLSKLEHDTKLVHSTLLDLNGNIDMKPNHPLPDVALWVEEVSLGFIGPLFIDAQVRWQHTLELGRLLMMHAMRVGPDDPEGDRKVALFVRLLSSLMTQPGTPLDASWLAGWVFPLVEMQRAIENRGNPSWLFRSTGATLTLVELLGFLDTRAVRRVLRSHPKTFEWVQTFLNEI